MPQTTPPAPARRRRRRTMLTAWSPAFTDLVDRRTCDHGSPGPRYCALCKDLARRIAAATGVPEYRR